MLKYFTFVCFLFSLEVSLSQDLTASLTMPEVVSPGEDFVVEVTIIKGELNSYLKFSQKLPAKFSATKIETRGGNFSFDDSIITIIWYFPPAPPEFTFSYLINVPEDASGIKKIGGKIYYFFNTDREIFSFEKTHLFVGTPEAYAASTTIVKVANTIPPTSFIEKEVPLISTNTVVITKTDTIITNNTSAPITTKIKAPKASKTKTKSQAAAIKGGLSYCVKLGTFKGEVPLEMDNKFLKISGRGLKKIKDNNGSTTFTIGNFKTYDEAIPLKNEMLGKGFSDAFIVTFKNRKMGR